MHEVTNDGTDRSQLSHVANETKAALGVEKLDAVADRGYFNSEEIRACEEAGITVTLPKPMTSNAKAKDASASRTSAMWLMNTLRLSCRRESRLPLHDRGKRIGVAPLLDQRLPKLRYQAHVHHGQGTTDLPMGARAYS